GPFKSWNALVNVITGATAIMYSFAPIALASLHKLAPEREHTYRMPFPKVILPAAFCSSNLIIYWGGFDATWKLVVAMSIGLTIFGVGAVVAKTESRKTVRNVIWIAPWLVGQVVIGALGNYGDGYEILPDWVDVATVIAFALGIYYFALSTTLTKEE